MAVKIVRGDVDLVRLGGGGDFHRLPHAIPGRVDNGDIHRLFAEVGHELAQAEERLARADRMRALLADGAERLRHKGVDFDPEYIEIRDRPQDLEIAFGLGVEIQIEQDVDIRACTVA